MIDYSYSSAVVTNNLIFYSLNCKTLGIPEWTLTTMNPSYEQCTSPSFTTLTQMALVLSRGVWGFNKRRIVDWPSGSSGWLSGYSASA